jgi:hypothetical protein
MPTPIVALIALAAAASAALPRAPDRRLAAWGLLASALGVASVSVAASGDVRLADLGAPSAAVDAGLELLGAFLVLAAGVRAWTMPPTSRVAAAAVVAVAVALGWLAEPVLAVAGLAACGAAAAIAAAGAAGIWLVTRGARALAPLQRRASSATLPVVGRLPLVLGVAGGAAALAGANAWIVVAGALCAACGPAAGPRRAPVLPLLVAAGLLPALWFMHTVAGPVGLGITTLEEIPFSEAAEAVFAPMLALGAFGFFGLWPVGRWGSRTLVPIGVALLIRLGAAAPSGLEAWQTILVPLGVAAAVHAVISAEPEEAVAAWAWLACVTGGDRGAILLGLTAVLVAAIPSLTRRAGAAAGAWGGRAAWALAASGGALALESLLRAQVVYALLTALALAVLIGTSARAPEHAR